MASGDFGEWFFKDMILKGIKLLNQRDWFSGLGVLAVGERWPEMFRRAPGAGAGQGLRWQGRVVDLSGSRGTGFAALR